MASGFFFNGQFYITPVTVSAVDDTAEQPSNATVGNTLAIVGLCDGGEPNTVLTFDDPTEVAATLISGPLCDAVTKSFAASADTDAPNKVLAIRVGQPTQGSLTLLDGQGNPSMTITSNQYGSQGNLPRIKVELGTKPNTLRVSVGNGMSYVSQDNLGASLATITYTGLSLTAMVNISPVACTVFVNGASVGALNFSASTVVQDIVNFVNTFAGFTAAVLGQYAMTQVYGTTDQLTYFVKNVTVTLTAINNAVVTWFNSAAEPYVNAKAAAVPGGALLAPAPIPWTYLAGAVYPAVLTIDWTNALNTLQSADCQWVVPLSGDPAIAAATDAHCAYMSTAASMERRALTGPNQGTTLAQVMALPMALDSDRTSICWPGYYDFNGAGVLTLYDPWMTAVLVAAGFAGQSPGQPMTNKTLKVQGLELSVRNPADTDQLISSGVLCLESTQEGYKVVRSITTWLLNNNYNRVEVSCGAAVDYTVRTVRNAVDPLRGGEASPQAIARAMTQAESALRLLAIPAPNGPGVIVGDANSPAYRNITASIQGDVLLVDYECSPVIPLNFIGTTAHIVPYSGSASALAAAA